MEYMYKDFVCEKKNVQFTVYYQQFTNIAGMYIFSIVFHSVWVGGCVCWKSIFKILDFHQLIPL